METIIKTKEEMLQNLTKDQVTKATKLQEKYLTFCKSFNVEPVFDFRNQIRACAIGEATI